VTSTGALTHPFHGSPDCPVFSPGLEDKIVLPNQAEMMVSALKAKVAGGVCPLAGEQHGRREYKACL